MSLYADTTAADPTQDFYDISWCDGAIDQDQNTTTIDTSTGPYTSYKALYPAISAGSNVATAQRLLELVNTSTGLDWDLPILVMPIDSSGGDGTNPFTNNDITGNGETWLDMGVTPNVITVAYDVNIENLNTLYYGPGGTLITVPRNVLLYHELSHAYHYATNTVGAVPAGGTCTAPQYASDEPQAETDENIFRISTHNGPRTTVDVLEAARKAGISVASLSVQSTTLDDVFVHYTGHDLRDALQSAVAYDSTFMYDRK